MDVAKFAVHFVAEEDDSDPETQVVDSWTTFHVRAETGTELDELALLLLCGAVRDWWREDVDEFVSARAGWSHALYLADIEARRIWPTEGDPVFTGPFTDTRGDTTGTPAPPQCALGVGLRTLENTRNGRGRMYLPPLDDDKCTATGRWSLRNNLDDLAALNAGAHLAHRILRTSGGGGSGPYVLVVWSRVQETAHAVTHFDVCEYALTQRRRCVFPRTYIPVGLSGFEP